MTIATETDQDLLRSIDAQLKTTSALARLQLSPEALKIHKAKRDGTGVALKLELRLTPEYGTGSKGSFFVRSVKGGLFLDLVPQTATNEAGDATFGWDDPRAVGAKLGLPDIGSLLVAVESRYASKAIPENLRAKGDELGVSVGMFHVFEGDSGKSTTAIDYRLAKEGAYLSMSKSATQRQKLMLTQAEELQLRAYLQHSLSMFLLVGKR